MMPWGGDGTWGRPPLGSAGGWLVALGLLLLLAAAVLLVVYVRRARTEPRRSDASHPGGWDSPGESQAPWQGETARDILRRRYASGQIEREDYLRRLSDLGRP